jgi:sugar lactone lactonase YvrE
VLALSPAGSGAPTVVFRAGQDYGGTTASTPAGIAWDQDGRRLLVLDGERTLFALTVETPPTTLPLRGADELRTPGAIAAYNGNLYILDVGALEVWRYAPAGEGFDSERSGLLGGLELATAHGLAIDGDVFVLSDDALRHFRLGEELTPLLTGVDRPPSPGAAVVEDVLRGRFYVADRGGERILVSDREGAFVSQFRHPAFFDLRGLAVSEDGSTLYVLTADGVFAFDPLVGFTPTP